MNGLKRTSACLLALALVFTAGCGHAGRGNIPELIEPAGMQPDNAAVTRGEIFNSITCEGLVLPRIQELSFSTGGIIDEVLVSIGSSVKAGDELARLDVSFYEEALKAAQSALDYSTRVWELNEKKAEAQLGIERIELKQMKSEGASDSAISLKEIRIAELENALEADRALWEIDRVSAEQNVAELEAQVSGSILRAPCDGTIVYSTALEGGYAMADAGLFSLAVDEQLYISTDYITAAQAGMALEIKATVAGKPVEVSYEAMDRVEYISRNDSGKDMTSTFAISDAGDVKVESGMSAVVTVVTEYEADALLVPTCAVRQDNTGYFVYRVSEDGKQVRQGIERGIHNDAYVQIISGLEEGDVVYAGN